MTAVRLRLASEFRSRRKAWIGLAILVGVSAGSVIAAVAGARRTDTAYPRFLSWSKAPDIFVFSSGEESYSFAQIPPEQLTALPQVAQSATGAGFQVLSPAEVTLQVPADSRIPYQFFHRKMLAGRQPRLDSPDEVSISFQLAKARHLDVGDRLVVQMLAAGPDGTPTPTTVSFKVVGVDAAASEFPPQTGTGVDVAWATPAFYRANVERFPSFVTTVLRLHHGSADVPAVQAEITRLAGGKPVTAFPLADQSVNTQHSIHLQAVALWLLAGLLALTAVLVLVQLLVRQSVLESSDHPSLRAIGMSGLQLLAVGTGRGAVVGVVGATVAVVVALLLSPLLPVGLARVAEPHPGFAVDTVAIGLGALATVALVAATAAVSSWRAGRLVVAGGPVGGARPSALAQVLSQRGASAPVTTGVRLALEAGRGPTAVPVRSTIVGAVVGVAALATALGFGASLGHLLATPRLYGVGWDASVTTTSSDDVAPALDAVRADPRIADLAVGYSGFPLAIGSVRADGIALDRDKGAASLMPTPIAGRQPIAPDEIMLGARTMAEAHVRLGDTVRASLAGSPPVTFRVVGKGVFPSLSDALGLGKGAATTTAGLKRSLAPGIDAPPLEIGLIRFRPGVDKKGTIADLAHRVTDTGSTVIAPEKPVDLVNFGRVQSLPLVLAALLGTLAAATLAHLMVTSIRRRRRDLAVLKTLGFSSRQVRGTVASQATTLGVVAAVVGIPVGAACGRWVWIVFARQLGIVPRPAIPVLMFLVLGLAALVVANLIAVLPGRAAARLRPAPVLRSE